MRSTDDQKLVELPSRASLSAQCSRAPARLIDGGPIATRDARTRRVRTWAGADEPRPFATHRNESTKSRRITTALVTTSAGASRSLPTCPVVRVGFWDSTRSTSRAPPGLPILAQLRHDDVAQDRAARVLRRARACAARGTGSVRPRAPRCPLARRPPRRLRAMHCRRSPVLASSPMSRVQAGSAIDMDDPEALASECSALRIVRHAGTDMRQRARACRLLGAFDRRTLFPAHTTRRRVNQADAHTLGG